jgi:predicted RNA-binding protein
MSVDNNAIIVVGLYYYNIPPANEYEDVFDFIEDIYKKYPDQVDKLDEFSTNEDKLIGYKIADSGSYGITTLSDDVTTVIEQRKAEFRKIFGLEPSVFLYNYQY